MRNAGRNGLSGRVEIGIDRLYSIADYCLEVAVDSHREDIIMMKAAKALAAFDSRAEVTSKDVDAAAEPALPHRVCRQPLMDIVESVEQVRQMKDPVWKSGTAKTGKRPDSPCLQSPGRDGDSSVIRKPSGAKVSWCFGGQYGKSFVSCSRSQSLVKTNEERAFGISSCPHQGRGQLECVGRAQRMGKQEPLGRVPDVFSWFNLGP